MGGGGVKVPLVFFTLSVAWAHLGLTPVSSCTLVLGSPSHRSSFFISIWHFGDPEFLWTGSPSSGSQESLRSEPFWNRVWPGLDAQSCAAHGGAERDFYTHVGTPLSRPSSLAPPLRPSRSPGFQSRGWHGFLCVSRMHFLPFVSLSFLEGGGKSGPPGLRGLVPPHEASGSSH